MPQIRVDSAISLYLFHLAGRGQMAAPLSDQNTSKRSRSALNRRDPDYYGWQNVLRAMPSGRAPFPAGARAPLKSAASSRIFDRRRRIG